MNMLFWIRCWNWIFGVYSKNDFHFMLEIYWSTSSPRALVYLDKFGTTFRIFNRPIRNVCQIEIRKKMRTTHTYGEFQFHKKIKHHRQTLQNSLSFLSSSAFFQANKMCDSLKKQMQGALAVCVRFFRNRIFFGSSRICLARSHLKTEVPIFFAFNGLSISFFFTLSDILNPELMLYVLLL